MLETVFDKASDIYEHRFPRPMIEFLVKKGNNTDLVGVEIGTQRGVNARNILKILPVKTLYLIDPYMFYDYNGRSVSAVDSDSIQDKYLLEAMSTLKKYKKSIMFLYQKSEDAVTSIPAGLDFVYIDGNHDYPFVKKDILLYWEKVKKGGVLGGHDINHSDVFKAVSEFRQQGDKDIYIKRKDWWFVK